VGGLKDTAKKISELTQRSCDLNKDFSVDFSTDGAAKYSKNSTTHKLGNEIFTRDFLIFMVGDKQDDLIKGNNAIFFPQIGTDAMNINSNIGIPVVDGIEYSLVIAYYLLNYYQ
jgi:hypothetical protein